jgi:hypothetical protein
MPDNTSAEHDEILAGLLTEMSERMRRADQVDLEAYCRQYPEHAAELRELWGAVVVANAAGSHSATTTLGSSPTGVSLLLPCRFGDYELLSELGHGGMGIVYRARQTSLNREVAVKMILRGQLATSIDHERFRTEAEAAAKLDHASIVPVYEVGEIRGLPYFSMKLVEGRTLAQRLAEGPLPAREAARILAAVARAIHFAHQRGVLHRDLKPSNILLDNEGKPHVSDFGLAKFVSDAASITRTGAAIGTPSYMAPEQAAGSRGTPGPAVDIYSLGAILYHMLTGRPPFQAASPVDTVLLLLEQDVVPPRVVNPGADPDLELIALRCLQKPTDLRYATAAALADDLDSYLADEPISARSGQFRQVLARMFRETHHATVLENWGLLWMWHSLVLLIACLLTNALHWFGFRDRWYYIVLWTVGLGLWAAVFWWLRRRMGPVTFVERQIAHVWASSMAAIGLLFVVEVLLNQPVLGLSPVLGLITGMVFVVKAGILSGTFYVQAAALFATSLLMARWPDFAHVIFGVVSAASFFVPGLKYYRQRSRSERVGAGVYF